MEKQLENKIKTGVFVKIDKTGKKVITGLIKNWNNLTKSIYNNEKNYMVLLGKKNNVIVIDLDNKGTFFKALEWFKKHFGLLELIKLILILFN